MPTTDTAELLKEIDAVIAETMQLFGDHDAAEAKRLTLENAHRLRAMNERPTYGSKRSGRAELRHGAPKILRGGLRSEHEV